MVRNTETTIGNTTPELKKPSKLFSQMRKQKISDTTPVLVKVIPGTEREGIDRRSGQSNFSVFVTDGGKLPVIDEEDRLVLKSVVFAHTNFAEKIIDDDLGAGFQDDDGNIYFLMAPQLPNASKTYWIREFKPYIIAYAQKLRANDSKLKNLMEAINLDG